MERQAETIQSLIINSIFLFDDHGINKINYLHYSTQLVFELYSFLYSNRPVDSVLLMLII